VMLLIAAWYEVLSYFHIVRHQLPIFSASYLFLLYCDIFCSLKFECDTVWCTHLNTHFTCFHFVQRRTHI